MGQNADPTTTSNTNTQRKSTFPPRFVVIMHNDDYTTMEFVVMVLEEVFHKSSNEANSIMLTIHTKGKAVCGRYPFEIAETKVEKVHHLAKQGGHPLRCSIQPA
ncbi:MAG: ATP-dependent Clp protease adaptor ClpS [Desulfuromonadaceae bacterium]